MPERLGASYVGEDGGRHVPVMLHRAILGSMERFIGILIEHYAGRFPLWLSPVQAVVATITGDADAYAAEVAREMTQAGLRIVVDTGNETINYKVREHSLARVPVILVVGKREAESRAVSLRRLGGNAQQALALAEAVDKLKVEAAVPAAS
jgi:threonyl-tRNA synthetase